MQSITFGTDGIRGNADQFPFTDEALVILGLALGGWMEKRYDGRPIKVLLAGDTRVSCDRIKQALMHGLEYFPVTVFDAGVIPTPAVLSIIKRDNSFACGIMISASHNPYQDNGIKLFDAQQGKITQRDEAMITEFFNWYSDARALHEPELHLQGSYQSLPSVRERYVEQLVGIAKPQLCRGYTVALDCANGATYQVAPAIFSALGATVITIHNTPTGSNINDHAGALHPEVLQKTVVDNRADIGFAFDGDGDRITVVSKFGVVKDGDDILAALMELPAYKDESVIVGTVMTNSGLQDYIEQKGKQLVRTPVGDKYIVAKLDELGARLGGESSGHVVLKDYLSSGDGILVAIKLFEALLLTGQWDMGLYNKRPQLMINVPVAGKRDLKAQPYAEIIAQHERMLGNGRVLVRYSGTENLLRVMVEGDDQAKTELIARELAASLQRALAQVEEQVHVDNI